VQANDKVVKLYLAKYLDVATQSRNISEYAYRRGGLALLDFLYAERNYRQTELGYRQTLASYLLALEQLREAVGTRTLP
jgi:cobalt-zinc-cadmium efflux system outer membrane protein